MISQTRYSLEVAGSVLPLLERTFGVEYALPKFDTFVVRIAVVSSYSLKLPFLTWPSFTFHLLIRFCRLVVLNPVRGIPALSETPSVLTINNGYMGTIII